MNLKGYFNQNEEILGSVGVRPQEELQCFSNEISKKLNEEEKLLISINISSVLSDWIFPISQDK